MEQTYDNPEEFLEFLILKKLSYGTKEQYIRKYYLLKDRINKQGYLDQQLANRFLSSHKNSGIARAFLKNYLEFADIRDIRITKVTGKNPKKKRVVLTKEQIINLTKYFATTGEKYIRYRNTCMFLLSYECALRRHELLKMRMRDFNTDKWLEDKSQPCELTVKGKGKKVDKLIVSPDLMKNIIEYGEMRLNDSDEGVRVMNLWRLSRAGWDKVFRKACRETIGVEYSLHDIRRARATHWWEDGLDITQIKIRLRHESITTTQLYIRPDIEKELDLWKESVRLS